jgi:hypothetical protein
MCLGRSKSWQKISLARTRPQTKLFNSYNYQSVFTLSFIAWIGSSHWSKRSLICKCPLELTHASLMIKVKKTFTRHKFNPTLHYWSVEFGTKVDWEIIMVPNFTQFEWIDWLKKLTPQLTLVNCNTKCKYCKSK